MLCFGSKDKHFVNYLPNPDEINSCLYLWFIMLLFLFYFFLAYMAYQLIFNFVLPIYRTTRQMRRGFRDMQNGMNGQTANQQTTSRPKGKPVGDYIDFEEVKET